MTVRVIQGDCRDVLRTLPAESVHCVVTSPPYYGLRDYGTAQWEGGNDTCDHEFQPDAGATSQRSGRSYQQGHPHRNCSCGARRIDRQIGLEPTPDEYIAELVAVFREVRRVLRKDGTVWLNIGDSYHNVRVSTTGQSVHNGELRAKVNGGNRYRQKGYKPKDLLMIPARVALALQADGWWLRSDIIWHKPNPMPESVTDRPTSSHEHVFLLAKAATYYFDADAVREEAVQGERFHGAYDKRPGATRERNGRNDEDNTTIGRNMRNVWTIATSPYPEAHFATFPPELAERCIKAGCPVGGTVLDPFGGAGTTGLVADRLQRNAILIELSADYCALADARLRGDLRDVEGPPVKPVHPGPLFAEAAQ